MIYIDMYIFHSLYPVFPSHPSIEHIFWSSRTYFSLLTSHGSGALVNLKHCMQWLARLLAFSGLRMEQIGESTQISSPALFKSYMLKDRDIHNSGALFSFWASKFKCQFWLISNLPLYLSLPSSSFPSLDRRKWPQTQKRRESVDCVLKFT